MSPKVSNTAPPKPSFMPVIIGGAAVLVSLSIMGLFRTGGPLIYLAYLCTPFAPIGGLALARATDIKGRTSIKFDIDKSEKVVKICGSIAILGFLIAIAVMYEIALRHSQV